jgi:acetoin utilization deacetylase AcuC-like enzyme
LYPGTGAAAERGTGEGWGSTLNIPLPAGATGDVYQAAWDVLVAPVVEQFGPTWLLLSAGFDAHRADPITDLGLAAGDYAALTETIAAVVPPGRRIAFLEGGYDLDALRAGTAAMVGSFVGLRHHPEPPTSGGPGRHVVERLDRVFRADPQSSAG